MLHMNGSWIYIQLNLYRRIKYLILISLSSGKASGEERIVGRDESQPEVTNLNSTHISLGALSIYVKA